MVLSYCMEQIEKLYEMVIRIALLVLRLFLLTILSKWLIDKASYYHSHN